MTTRTTTPTPTEVRAHLRLLLLERALADAAGLASNVHYMADLDEEIAATRAAFVGAAVTDIATLRGQLSGPLAG